MTAAVAANATTCSSCALRLLVRIYRPDDLEWLDKLGWHDDDLDAAANELWGTVGQKQPVTLSMVLGFDETRLNFDWRDRVLDGQADRFGEVAFGLYCGPERSDRSVSA